MPKETDKIIAPIKGASFEDVARKIVGGPTSKGATAKGSPLQEGDDISSVPVKTLQVMASDAHELVVLRALIVSPSIAGSPGRETVTTFHMNSKQALELAGKLIEAVQLLELQQPPPGGRRSH